MISRIRNHWPIPAVVLLSLLGGCLEEEKVPLSYSAINRTDKNIVSIAINGKGGVLDASAQSGGGDAICCVHLPQKWRPGLMAKIAWQEGGVFKRDESGNILKERGVPVVIESPWKEKSVEIPRYPEGMGTFYMVFFPNDDVRVAIKNGYPTEILPKDDRLQPKGQ